MEIEAPYLQAIQAIAGKTPGEKHRTINDIARRIARAESSSSSSTSLWLYSLVNNIRGKFQSAKSSGGHSVDAETQIPDVPEPLKPLVRVEVAKILHRYDGIIEALKSEDIDVVSRALKAKWFFDGSDSSLVNAKYFLENVFPEISLYVRFKIVKRFAMYLKNTAVAEDFFLTLTEQYGVSQANPLLVVCSEDFTSQMMVENKTVLSLRMVKMLYRKYPDLVIDYLLLSEPDDERNVYRININDYKNFLPELAVKRFEDFMAIYCMHDGMIDVKLGKKATNTFLKTKLDLLLEEPDQYLKLVPLKTVTQKLSVGEFAKMFKNLFPAEKSAFRFSTLNKYLQYYKPEQEKIPLILNTFREVYGEDLLSCKNIVDYDLIKMLPAEERVKQARLKLEDDKDWHLHDRNRSWRCYLPTSESITAIIKEIAKSSDVNKRGWLLKQMIYTSRVNNDQAALLKVLNYIYDRHRNDQKHIFYRCLSMICDSFDLATLSSAHWEVIHKYIKFSEMQGDLFSNETITMVQVIAAALHYCLLNDLPLDDYLRLFLQTRIRGGHSDWNILTKYPELEKKFLELFIEVIPKEYPFDKESWKNSEGHIITSLASSLWSFNKRHKVTNGKLQKLCIKDYTWLFEKIKAYVLDPTDEYYYSKHRFLVQIQENERDIYHLLVRDLEKFWNYGTDIIYDVLKVAPQRVLDNYIECLENVMSKIHREKHPSLFIIKCRWYQQLPMKFLTETLKTYKDPKTCVDSMAILALLTDGPTYTKIIEPFIPNDEKIDADDPEAANTHNMLVAITNNLQKLNPPVSLDIIARFCVSDYLQMAVRSLTSVCCRVPVSKVIPIARILINRPVSVKKHGIRLMYMVSPLEEIYSCLTDLWNSEAHTSIRLVVFIKIYDLFCNQPESRNWRMVQTCVDSLNPNDDGEICRNLTGLSKIPNDYLCEYIKSVLNAMKSMDRNNDHSKLYIKVPCQLIGNIDVPITQILPEEYCQDLIKEYLFAFDYNSDVFAAGMNLTVCSYLLSSETYDESRFKFFGDLFRHSVKKYWDQPHPKCSKFYPINHMVHEFFARISSLTTDKYDVRIFESLLEIFQSALQPYQDAVSYLDLVYSIAYHTSETSVDFGTKIAQKIPDLIEVFSAEYVISMSNRLSSFVEYRTFCESESNEEKLISIIEVFVNSGAIHCAFFAANMLFNNTSKKLTERHKSVIHALRNFHHPGVSWLLNERLATFDFRTDSND